MNRLVRATSIIQRRSVVPAQRLTIMRNAEEKIREREMALEDDYVRRVEKERVEIEKSKNEIPKNKTKSKKGKGDASLLNNSKVDKYPGRLSNSGIIF